MAFGTRREVEIMGEGEVMNTQKARKGGEPFRAFVWVFVVG